MTHVTEVIKRVCSCDRIANQRVRSRTGSGAVGQFVVNVVNRVEISGRQNWTDCQVYGYFRQFDYEGQG